MSVNVPIMSDETGKKLVEAQKAANVTSREIRQLVSAQNEIMTEISQSLLRSVMFEVPAIYVEGGTPTYMPAIVGSEILAAYQEGKHLVLSIYDGTQKAQYRILLSSATLKGGIMWQFGFVSTDGNNPMGVSATFYVNYIVNDGTVTISASTS